MGIADFLHKHGKGFGKRAAPPTGIHSGKTSPGFAAKMSRGLAPSVHNSDC